MRFLITLIYSFLIFWFLFKNQYLYLVITVLTIPFLLLFLKLRKISIIRSYKAQIEKAKENKAEIIYFKPFIDVNKVPCYVLELIPGVSRVRAKAVSNYAKKAKINDFTEFANLADLPVAHYPLVKLIVKFY